MQSTDKLITEILVRFKKQGYAQVAEYNRFGFISETDNYVLVSREKGKDTKIYFNKISKAIDAVRKDHKVFTEGPSRLRKYGLTHIMSPLWALIHLLTLEELMD